MNEPAIIFADEPTANLDTQSAQTVMQTLRKLNETLGVTVVFVSHDPDDSRYATPARSTSATASSATAARARPVDDAACEGVGTRVACVVSSGRSVLTRSNYGIAATTTLMMLLIYMSLLFLPSLIQGAINRVNAQLVNTLTSNIVITPASKAASINDVGAYLAKIRQTAGVAAPPPSTASARRSPTAPTPGSWAVDAIDPASYGQVFTTPSNILEGRALTAGDTSQVLLGIGIAGAGQTSVRGYRASLQSVHAGDKVSITLINGRSRHVHRRRHLRQPVPAVRQQRLHHEAEAQKLLPASIDHATTIYVRTDSGANVNQVVTGSARCAAA